MVSKRQKQQKEFPLIQFDHVTKCFGSVIANRDICLDIQTEEIHAVVGENGAGKSTLMGLLFGHFQPDAGEIRIHGRTVRFKHPRDAIAAGIGMVHQQLMIFPQLTVLENVVLGAEPAAGLWIKKKQAHRRVETLLETFGFDIPLACPAATLSFAHHQQIELLRLLYRDAQILILDEPTSLLAEPEIQQLLQLLERLRRQGRTILFVSHRLHEVFAVADRITVLRRGQKIGTVMARDVSITEVARFIMGTDDLHENPPLNGTLRLEGPKPGKSRTKKASPQVLVRMKDVSTAPIGQEAGLDQCSLDIQRGEILGFGGIVGNGLRSLAQCLAGLLPPTAGTITINGRDCTEQNVMQRIQSGIRWLPADPLQEALMPEQSIWKNFLLGHQRRGLFNRNGCLRIDVIKNWTRQALGVMEVVYDNVDAPITSLSGGNQQKLALARIFEKASKLIVVEQPARGLDIRAQNRCYDSIRKLNAKGVSFIVCSYDIDELLRLCDRIGILYRGRLMGICPRRDANRYELGRWMLGYQYS